MSGPPHEFAIEGVYMPPLLVASFLAVIATIVTVYFLEYASRFPNRFYFYDS